jgi:glycine/D-amino acid oxidase-like deaminating enzyme
LKDEERAHCAIIGAGFTGLAAARHLAKLQPDWRIVVLDAQRAGDGASGRSSGFLVDLAGFIQAMEPEQGRRFIGLSRHGIEELRRLTQEFRIECAWDEKGWLHAAAGDVGLRSLEALPSWLEELEEPFECLNPTAIERITGSRFYRAGLRLPGSVLVQSAALVRGLADHLPENVDLFENSAVLRLEGGSPFRLETTGGAMTAERLIVATNGYMPALGLLKRRVFPLVSFGSLTRPLSTGEQALLGGEEEWGLLAQDPMGSSIRRTRDQRILIRNGLHYSPNLRVSAGLRRKARQLHLHALRARFPGLANIEFDFTWAGILGASRNQAPFFGHLRKDVVATAGFTGAGIAIGTTCGEALADLLVGAETPHLRDLLTLPGPSWIPPEPFLSPGIRWRVHRMNRTAYPTL